MAFKMRHFPKEYNLVIDPDLSPKTVTLMPSAVRLAGLIGLHHPKGQPCPGLACVGSPVPVTPFPAACWAQSTGRLNLLVIALRSDIVSLT